MLIYLLVILCALLAQIISVLKDGKRSTKEDDEGDQGADRHRLTQVQAAPLTLQGPQEPGNHQRGEITGQQNQGEIEKSGRRSHDCREGGQWTENGSR